MEKVPSENAEGGGGSAPGHPWNPKLAHNTIVSLPSAILNTDSYVSEDFATSPWWLRYLLVNSESPTSLSDSGSYIFYPT